MNTMTSTRKYNYATIFLQNLFLFRNILFRNEKQPVLWLLEKATCSLHGTIIRTGITCKNTPCYMRDSDCRWFIVKKATIFQSYVKHF